MQSIREKSGAQAQGAHVLRRAAAAPGRAAARLAAKLLDEETLTDARVLIIDPFEASRSVLRDTVVSLGARNLVSATSYTDAMRRLTGAVLPWTLIFCEYNLNGPRDGQHLLEEIRSQQIIPLSASFVMATAESSYRRVVAVAEFAPDAYVIKPYAIQQLRRRVLRSLRKKRTLAPAYMLMESGEKALGAEHCLRIGDQHAEFATDCWRLAAELLIGLGDVEHAERLLQRVLRTRALPWATLGLARLRMSDGRLEEAIQMLQGLLRDSPQYLKLRDTIAELHIKLGRPAQALEVLEEAIRISSSNVVRLRRMGEVAESMGDLARAEAAFGKVLQRTRDSSLLSGEDYANISRTLVAQGKLDEAGALAAEQQRTMKGHKDLELSTWMLELHRMVRSYPAGVPEAIRKIIDVEARDTAGELSPRLVVQAVRACLENGAEEDGLQIADKLKQRARLPPEVREEVEELLGRYDLRQLRRDNLSAAQVEAAIRTILDNGFDDAVARKIDRALPHLKHSVEPLWLEAIYSQWAAAKTKYGMAG